MAEVGVGGWPYLDENLPALCLATLTHHWWWTPSSHGRTHPRQFHMYHNFWHLVLAEVTLLDQLQAFSGLEFCAVSVETRELNWPDLPLWMQSEDSHQYNQWYLCNMRRKLENGQCAKPSLWRLPPSSTTLPQWKRPLLLSCQLKWNTFAKNSKWPKWQHDQFCSPTLYGKSRTQPSKMSPSSDHIVCAQF